MENKFYELTNPQKSIWYTEEYYKGSPINNICGSLIIRQKVNLEILSSAINHFIKINDSFKLRFKIINGVPYQYFTADEDFNFDIVNINNESQIDIYANNWVNLPFNLLNSKPFDFKLFKLENGFGGFIFNCHHIISDAATFSIVAKEIVQIYSKLLKNEELPTKTYSYLDFIYSERKYSSSEKLEKDKKYWDELLTPLPEVATVPVYDREQVKAYSIESARKEFIFDNILLNKIKSYCSNNNVSLFSFLFSVYSLYLGRINNMEKFLIGTPILNRANYAEKHTSGMFISTSLLKIDLSENCKFSELVYKNYASLMSMLRHQKYNYQYVIEDLRERDNSISNLYDVLLSYQITKATDKSLDINYDTKWYGTNYLANTLSIHFHDNNDTGNIAVEYDYQISKLSEYEIEKMHNRIIFILKQIIEDDSKNINNIDIITPFEKDEILNIFNTNSISYNNDKDLIQLFKSIVQNHPNKTALFFEGQEVTYLELDELSDNLASYLLQFNVNYEDKIAIFLDKSVEMIVSILAILKVNAAFLPIDIDYPIDRIKYIINDAKVKIALTHSKFKDKLNNLCKNICIDTLTLNQEKDFIYNSASSSSLAYVMYTSGSTGKPKGVMIEQKSILRLAIKPNFIEFSESERILQTGSIVFDACTFEIWAALLNGFTLYILKKNDLLNPAYLGNYLVQNKISILWITAPLFNQLSDINPSMFGSVKYLLTGGDVLSVKHINKVLKHNPNLQIINGYGPTENTTFSTCFKIKHEYSTNIPIGSPISGTTCYIVSKAGLLQPIGYPGELWVGGDGVSRGYLNRDDLTKEKFINNPFKNNSRLYKTGDLVKWNSNGTIDFIGRIDGQVKIRGFRVELNEITNTIFNYPNIKNCITIIQNLDGNKEICSYIIPNVEIDINSLKSFLELSLPSYMVPTHIIVMESFPININGKIDKSKLPMPKLANKSSNIVKPHSETEKTIYSKFCKLLNLNEISIDTNFSNIGIDSLSAIKLSVSLNDTFKTNISVKDIFEANTIQKLSKIIDKNINESHINTIKKCEIQDYYRVSSAQKRIYFASQIAGENSVLYNIPGGIIVDGTIDFSKLEKCINTLIDRHESLRTYFELKNSEVVQKILPQYQLKLDVVQYSDFKDIDLLFNDFVQPFDLSVAPLFRIKALTFTNGKSAIFIDMHHIISDGTSLSVFTDELCQLYNGNILKPLHITYKDFAEYEKTLINTNFYSESEEYWLTSFKDDVPVLNLPTNYARPANKSYEGHKIHCCIDETTTNNIKQVSSNIGITPYMLLLGCYYILLSRYSSQEDIVVGSPVVGRDIYETYNIIGMFVNTLALRNTVDSSLTVKEFLLTLKNNLLNAYKYQTYPFDELVNKLNISRDSSRNPLFDTMFTYQNMGYKNLDFYGIKTNYYIPDTNISKFDLSIEAVPEEAIINLSFEYATDLFNSDFIKQLSNHYLNIVQEVLNNLDIKISDIKMISEEERNKIIYSFNNNDLDYPKNKNIVDLFEEQVKKAPNNIAVVFQDQKMTYKELNEKANSLAHYLLQTGAKKGDIIPIVMNRNINLIISMLATIKIGAVYLPLSIELPLERIKYIIKDSNSKLIITDFEYVSNDNIKIIDIKDINYYNYSVSNLNIEISPYDILYIIYTSGSTGNPKGVKVTHNNLSNFIHSFNHLYGNINSKDRLLASTSISFDVSIFELFISLLNGCYLYLYDEPHINDIYKYCENLYKNKITFAYIPPNILDLVYEILSSFDKIHLNKLLIGVEPIKSDTIRKYYLLNPNLKVLNAYGPTETTICATGLLIDKKVLEKYAILPIGKPLNNLKIFILDKNMNIVPINIPGEIYISGDNVSNGYLNNKELSNKSFIKIDKLNCHYAYKTGDLATWDENGNINFIGRNDFQLKLNGYRIELKEIETAMLKFPHIKKVLVQKQNLDQREFLTAYYVADRKIALNELKNYLSTFLPKYMIPNYYISLDDFPYNSNGKIDRKVLPLPSAIIHSNKENFVAPSTELQKQLAAIFEKLLNISPIGINDNFFELGGDSILAMSLNIELLKISNKITYKDIFMYSTVAELEKKINSNNDTPFFNKIEDLSDSFNDILNNTINLKKTSKYRPKNILLAGATGFLGMHIIEKLLLSGNSNIYCLVRKGKHISAKEKLRERMHYYFGMKYDHFLDKRIFIVTGEITKTNFGLNNDDYLKLSHNIDTVINSAANVSHYGNYNDFYGINVTGVNNIIEFCELNNKKLYHISTISVVGTNLNTAYPSLNEKKNVIFNESSLYIGQIIDNFYSYTKFEAEVNILTAINQGLDAYILRMGNLMPRLRDGVFQKNISDNDFVGKITSFMKIEAIPDYLLDYELNFTPIDQAAKVIYKLITHPNSTNRIFHIYNRNNISPKKFIAILKKMDYDIKVLPEKKFTEKVEKIINNEKTRNMIYNLTNDFDENLHLNYKSEIIIESDFTNKYLKKLHYKWPKITNRYLINFINLLRREL